jgi:hypothetical protein
VITGSVLRAATWALHAYQLVTEGMKKRSYKLKLLDHVTHPSAGDSNVDLRDTRFNGTILKNQKNPRRFFKNKIITLIKLRNFPKNLPTNFETRKNRSTFGFGKSRIKKMLIARHKTVRGNHFCWAGRAQRLHPAGTGQTSAST